MEAQLVGLAVQTYKTALMLALPMLLGGLVTGLLVSIFQAATQINEMTLTFVPKILVVISILIFIMPWMMNMIMKFSIDMLNMIPEFPF